MICQPTVSPQGSSVRDYVYDDYGDRGGLLSMVRWGEVFHIIMFTLGDEHEVCVL